MLITHTGTAGRLRRCDREAGSRQESNVRFLRSKLVYWTTKRWPQLRRRQWLSTLFTPPAEPAPMQILARADSERKEVIHLSTRDAPQAPKRGASSWRLFVVRGITS